MVRRREAVYPHPPFEVDTQHYLQFALGFGLVAIGYSPSALIMRRLLKTPCGEAARRESPESYRKLYGEGSEQLRTKR